MQKGINKKGQDLSIGTLILIVLGIIVLVLLVLGFSLGWGNLWEKINIFGGGNSIGDVVTACNLAATQSNNGMYSYCQDFKKVKVNSQTEYVNCQDDRVQSSLSTKLTCPAEYLDKQTSSKKYCTDLRSGSNFDEKTIVNGQSCLVWGVAKEPPKKCSDLTLGDNKGVWEPEACDDQTKTDVTAQVTDTTDKQANANKHCCVLKPTSE